VIRCSNNVTLGRVPSMRDFEAITVAWTNEVLAIWPVVVPKLGDYTVECEARGRNEVQVLVCSFVLKPGRPYHMGTACATSMYNVQLPKGRRVGVDERLSLRRRG
jgi:hypothetical protein